MVIVVENEHGDMSSNPGRDIAFHRAVIPLNPIILPPAMGSRADCSSALVRQLV